MEDARIEAVNARKQALLAAYARSDLSEDLYGAYALIDLAAGQYAAQANEKLREVARWFEKAHPKGRDPFGECDFAAMKLAWAYGRFGEEGLEPATLEAIRTFFLTYDFQSKYTSENHLLLFHTSRYLMAAALPEETFGRYGLDGRTLAAAERAYLRDFIALRARRGWDEFDSGCYFAPVWEALSALCDLAPDEEIRCMARMMMNVRLADMAVDSLEGMYCGAHGRIYERYALDHRTECTFFLQYVYFGGRCLNTEPVPAEALVSRFVPEAIVESIFRDRHMPYWTRERVRLHCSTYLAPERPLPQENVSLRKITYVTARYALGCVQWEDDYAPGSLAAWHRGHQQHEWDLTFAGGDTDCRIFTHHPGHSGAEGAEHGYWTGDMLCNCSSHYQHGRAVLSLYNIPEAEECGFIHAYVPRARFDETLVRGNSIYVRRGGVYAMLRFVRPFRWVEEGPYAGVEAISNGRRNGAVAEVCEAEEFEGFDAFIAQMEENTLTLEEQSMTLTYRSAQNGEIVLTRTSRTVNGEKAQLDYPAFESPYLTSEWDSGVITLRCAGQKRIYDFNGVCQA